MRKIIYAMSVSLDGFIEAADGDLSWSDPDEELHSHFNALEKEISLHFYGRRLYEIMAASWPTAEENPSAPGFVIEYARIWKAMKKIVFSTTLKQVGWNSELFSGDIAAQVNKLKAQPGGDMSVGGSGLAASFMRLGLIDEYQLYLRPILLGGGKPMFPPLDESVRLQLVETHIFGSGVVLLKYKRSESGT
jgi:dihydrofolate reductase